MDMLPSDLSIYFLSYIIEDLEDSLALSPTGKIYLNDRAGCECLKMLQNG